MLMQPSADMETGEVRGPNWRRAPYLVAAAVLAGQVIAFARREFRLAPVVFALVALGLTTGGTFARLSRPIRRPWVSRCVLLGFVIAGLVIALWRLPFVDLYLTAPRARPVVGTFVWLAAVAVALIVLILIDRPCGLAGYAFPFLLAVHFAMGMWFLRLSFEPRIDVYLIQRLGCDALLNGHDPYAITFPDIYGPHAGFYRPELVRDGVVQCGYFYLPLSLLLDLPAHVAGDVRYTQLAALTIAAALVAYASPRREARGISCAIAALLLFTPQVFHTLENAWIEPQMLMFLAAIAFVVARGLPGRFVLMGLLVAVKQYGIFLVPLVPLLTVDGPVTPARVLRALMIVAITAAGVTLPFVLWDPRAFLHSTTALYVGMLRTDSVSLLAWLNVRTGVRPPMLVTTVAGFLAAALAAWRAPRGATGFAAAVAFVLLVVFLFGTQSFANYYFLVAGALLVAAGAAATEPVADRAPPIT